MASELKPCPFCGGEAKHMVWGGGGLVASVPHSKVCCTECRMTTGPVQKHEDGDRAIERWNTRPAPAATDTGLETVAENLARTIWGYFKGGPDAIAWFDNNKSLGGPAWLIEQCRSRAEELLAAKDEKIAIWRKLWTDTDRLRIEAIDRAEKAEAKLAAAEKALEPFALISSEGVIKQEAGHVTVITCAEYFHKARAVLGGKPS
ncbi:Lar family restriction alleviation protein [Brucella intermedia]|uniref:Lar family restriction alleviation protein n=1 Tax=Brucella intermedia TaxID=94625 RepID=UPI0023607C88|nr:Lar family restriction alleviation protein [Brucella intermedia]